jgi:hypothetical protein
VSNGPSSRVDAERGEVVVMSPCSWAEPGQRLRIVASSQTFGVDFSDWTKRLLSPSNVVRATDEEIARVVALGLLHPSLLEEPRGQEEAA